MGCPADVGRGDPIPAAGGAFQAARWRRCRRSKDVQSVSAPGALPSHHLDDAAIHLERVTAP
jgi:hypothetical protein